MLNVCANADDTVYSHSLDALGVIFQRTDMTDLPQKLQLTVHTAVHA